MNRAGRAAILLCLGGAMLRLVANGGFGWFVQQRMRIPLAIAAVALVALGAVEAIAGLREERRDPDARGRWRGPAVGWLLLAPLLVLVAVAPTGLGAAAADRIDAVTPAETTVDFAPLDNTAGPVDLRIFDFLDRALWDDERSLEGTVVRLEGLVVNDESVPDGFRLTRFLVTCCAADGVPVQVVVHGTGQPLPDDTWVAVELVWRPPTVPYQDQEGDWAVEADAVRVTVIPDPPNDAYESPF